MALLNILQFPDPRLKTIAAPIEQFDAELTTLVGNLFDTMYEAHGVGLAAIQVNIPKRVIVLDISREGNEPMHLINPTIVQKEGVIEWEEGCLSLPSVFGKVDRAKAIDVHFFDVKGEAKQLHAEALMAVCIQHEIDHLNGITFYDHLSPLKQMLLRKKLEKIRSKAL